LASSQQFVVVNAHAREDSVKKRMGVVTVKNFRRVDAAVNHIEKGVPPSSGSKGVFVDCGEELNISILLEIPI
jgi:hypothetical protein